MNAPTFPAEWMERLAITEIALLPLPGHPILIVHHLVNGYPHKFGVKLFEPVEFRAQGYQEREAIVLQAMKQVEIGVEQQTAELFGTLL